MLRKTIYRFILFIVVIALVACDTAVDETTTSVGDPSAREIPTELKLMLGTVLLDNTDYAVDADQATELLPLYKVLSTLTNSDTAAEAEVDAVIASIQDIMTTEQMAAIDSMDLSMTEMSQVFEILEIETNFGSGFSQMTQEQQATAEAMRESGEFPGPGGGMGLRPGGGMGPGGGGIGGETGISPEMRETAMAERGNGTGRGFGINQQLLEAIISFLEAK
jgi:hypothetical protein